MCQFTYTEYPCGCKHYHDKYIRYCEIQAPRSNGNTSHRQPTLMIPATDEHGNSIDYCDGNVGIRIKTAPQDPKNQFTWFPCKEKTYFRERIADQAGDRCPWHVDHVQNLELEKRSKAIEEKRKRDDKKKDKKEDKKAHLQQLARQSGKYQTEYEKKKDAEDVAKQLATQGSCVVQ